MLIQRSHEQRKYKYNILVSVDSFSTRNNFARNELILNFNFTPHSVISFLPLNAFVISWGRDRDYISSDTYLHTVIVRGKLQTVSSSLTLLTWYVYEQPETGKYYGLILSKVNETVCWNVFAFSMSHFSFLSEDLTCNFNL